MTTSNKYSLDNLDKRFFFNQELIEQSFLNQNLDISLTHVDDFEFTVEVLGYGDCFATILDKIYAIAIESFWSKRKFKICPIQTQSEIPFFMKEPIFVDAFLIHSCNTKAQNSTDYVKQIIIKKYEKMRTTLKNGDPNYVLEMHANDAVLFLPNEKEVVSITTLKPFYEKVALTGIDIKSTPISVELFSENVAYEVGTFISTSKTGVQNSAKYINIWKKINGDWKLYKAIDQAKL